MVIWRRVYYSLHLNLLVYIEQNYETFWSKYIQQTKMERELDGVLLTSIKLVLCETISLLLYMGLNSLINTIISI